MLNLFWNYWIEAAEEDLLERWKPAEYYHFDEMWNNSIFCEGQREPEQSNAVGIKQHHCVNSLSLSLSLSLIYIYMSFLKNIYISLTVTVHKWNCHDWLKPFWQRNNCRCYWPTCMQSSGNVLPFDCISGAAWVDIPCSFVVTQW